MTKKEITYNTLLNDEIVEVKENIFFNYTISTLRLYESEYESYLYDDYQKALDDLSDLDFEKIEKGEIKENEMLSVLASPNLLKFTQQIIPCLYAEKDNNRLIQNEQTFINMVESDFYTDLINLEFFFDIMSLLSKNQKMNNITKKKAQTKN